MPPRFHTRRSHRVKPYLKSPARNSLEDDKVITLSPGEQVTSLLSTAHASDTSEAVKKPRETGPKGSASTGVFRPIEDLVQVSKGHANAHVIDGRTEWPESMGQPRFSAKELDLRAWSIWCEEHFMAPCIRKYSGPLFDKGWYGTLSGEEWATMYYLGFAERMPEGMVYEGPAKPRAKPRASEKSEDDAEKIPEWMF